MISNMNLKIIDYSTHSNNDCLKERIEENPRNPLQRDVWNTVIDNRLQIQWRNRSTFTPVKMVTNFSNNYFSQYHWFALLLNDKILKQEIIYNVDQNTGANFRGELTTSRNQPTPVPTDKKDDWKVTNLQCNVNHPTVAHYLISMKQNTR